MSLANSDNHIKLLCEKFCANRRAHIRHLCRKTTVFNCHRCLINTGVEKMSKIKKIDQSFVPPVGLYHKTYHGCKLRIAIISQSVCPWRAFPAQSSVWVRLGAHPKVEHLKGVYSGRLWPYPQTIDQAGKACQEQTLQLIMEICELQPQ